MKLTKDDMSLLKQMVQLIKGVIEMKPEEFVEAVEGKEEEKPVEKKKKTTKKKTTKKTTKKRKTKKNAE
ncbi:MAG: hypothetical protein NWE78_05230 [Candidatus Bathyarchaeota archaeon]|nr:hypothetical protein [Candidatus Bathyarchaeota archaeon]